MTDHTAPLERSEAERAARRRETDASGTPSTPTSLHQSADTPVIRAMRLFVVMLNYTGLLWMSGAIPWHSPKMIERLVSYVQ